MLEELLDELDEVLLLSESLSESLSLSDEDEEDEEEDESRRLRRFFPAPLVRPRTAAILASYSALGSGGASPVKSAKRCLTFGFFSCCVRDGRDTYTREFASLQHSNVHFPTFRHRWHLGWDPDPAPPPTLRGLFTNMVFDRDARRRATRSPSVDAAPRASRVDRRLETVGRRSRRQN